MSDNSTEWTENNTRIVVAVAHNSYNFPALIFGILLTIVITGGNVLVCVSVYLEKALKTTTNYFIVSLAFADLLLAILVLPLFVYTQVSPDLLDLLANYFILYSICCRVLATTLPNTIR